MATTDWTSFAKTLATTEAPEGAKKAAKPGKTPRDKMVENFDAQLAQFNSGKPFPTVMGQRKAWFKAIGDKVAVQVRFAGQAIKLLDGQDTIYTDKKNLKNLAKGLRTALTDGTFDAELKELEAGLAKRIETRKANKAK